MVKVTFLFDPSKASEGHSRASICHSRASICHSRASICHSRENENPDTYPPLTRRPFGGFIRHAESPPKAGLPERSNLPFGNRPASGNLLVRPRKKPQKIPKFENFLLAFLSERRV
jgi:hypothetical protein